VVELWFAIAAVTVTIYVVMDGFDFGAGALHLFVARNDHERRQVLNAIGPFWDGNEVWLLASGGVLFVAFPKVLASGLSGFYLAIFLVLWVLILRGIAIEFRSHIENQLWRTAWDVVFAGASTLMPVLLGAALGNLLRGLPLDRNGWFSLPLFTDFTTRGEVGILDWYTVLTGVFALVALTAHGATFLAWKTDGAVQARSRVAATWCIAIVVVLWPLMTYATANVNEQMYAALGRRPLAWLALVIAVGGLASVARGLVGRSPLAAFLGSSAFLAGLLGATASLIFPVMLRATTSGQWSLTAYGSAMPATSLRIALAWWLVAAPLAIAYFVVLFRIHRGKVAISHGHHGY
jgi:cytochrome bd ubiquinol oxidase subunit II